MFSVRQLLTLKFYVFFAPDLMSFGDHYLLDFEKKILFSLVVLDMIVSWPAGLWAEAHSRGHSFLALIIRPCLVLGVTSGCCMGCLILIKKTNYRISH